MEKHSVRDIAEPSVPRTSPTGEAIASDYDRWDAVALLAIFIVAIGVRLVYLHQVWSLPFFEFPIVDARSYDQWAQTIAAGNWLGDRVFYQAPAYPYFLAVLYSVFGHDFFVVHVVQMCVGALSCQLVYVATRQIFDRTAAVPAAFLLALYGPAFFFDGILQKTCLGLFLTALLLVALARFVSAPGTGRAFLCAVVVGLLSLTREQALLFALLIPAWFLIRLSGHRMRKRLVWALAFGAGLAVVLIPVGARNRVVGDTFAITTAQMGPNFYIGNNENATGFYAPLLGGRHTPDFEASDAARLAEWQSGRALSRGEVSSYWMGKSLAWIRSDPAGWLSLLFAKALLTINDFEVPDTEDVYVYAESSPLLAMILPVMRFGSLFPLGIAGLVFAWRERRTRRGGTTDELLVVLGFVFAGSVAVFYVWARYRFPLVPLLLPFAGLAIARGLATVRRGSFRPLVVPTAALLVAAGVANLPLVDRKPFQQTTWTNLGNIMLRHERLDDAESYLMRALQIDENGSDLQFHLAILRFRQHRNDEAEQHVRRTLESQPADFRGHRLLAQILQRQGRAAEAKRHLIESVRLDPDRQRRGRPGAPRPRPSLEFAPVPQPPEPAP